MSRYKVPPHDFKPEAYVGWDNPMTTFFGYVYDLTLENDDEQSDLILSVGDEDMGSPQLGTCNS